MTASTIKSTQISNAETVPVTLSTAPKSGGKCRQWTATIEVPTTSTDEVGDIIKMIRVPANLVPTKVTVFNDDLDSHSTPTLAADAGMYRSDTGAVILATGLATAITTLQAANTTGVNVMTEAHDIADIGKTMWELAGLTARPDYMIDIAFTITATAATGAAGTVSMIIEGALSN